jgi:HK97 family phage major capsid protein
MNADASIALVKSLDAEALAASGESISTLTPAVAGIPSTTPAVVGTSRVVKTTRTDTRMKTIAERKQAFEAEKSAKVAKMNELMGDDDATLDAAQQEAFDTLDEEVKSLDGQLARLETLEKANIRAAVPVVGDTPDAAAAARGGDTVIRVKEVLPPGIGFARAAKVRLVARMDHRNIHEVAKEMYPHDDRLAAHLKAAVPAGTTTQTDWASALVDPTNLANEFIEFLRPKTIIGKFGADGIPALHAIPFNVRIIEQTDGGNGYWVGQGAPKPLTAFGFAPITLGYTKVAAISVITQELARFSSPSAERLVRDSLAAAVIARIDTDFVDPAAAAVANVQPASITNGLTALSSAGVSADNARTDLANLLSTFIEANLDPTSVVLIMPATLALALSVMVNSLGQPEFPGLTMNGGRLNGIPVITSQYAANASGGGNLVIALNASDVFLADDGQVTIDASDQVSLQMLDNPTNNSATATATTMVSMWQTNSIAIRAERFINWSKRRAEAVVYMDDVNWGSIGSPP